MAAGDVVAGLGTVATTFQPAAGVEVVLTSWGSNRQWVKMTNGASNSFVWYFSDTAPNLQSQNMGQGSGGSKLCINNTIYITLPASVDNNYYCGIQIK